VQRYCLFDNLQIFHRKNDNLYIRFYKNNK